MRKNVTLPIAAVLTAAFGLSSPVAATEAIAVPGETLVATVQAAGTQLYECKADMSGRLVWQFREPVATLFKDGQTVGRHYAGPNWEMTDGSAVSAKVSGRAPGASGSDIPLLRLDVASRRGKGQLADVTTIQRLNTRGGVAEGACEQAGTLLNVPYTADYAFYRKPGVVSAPVQSRPATVYVPVAAPLPAAVPAVSVIVLPRDIPHRPKKKKQSGQPKSPPTAEPKTPPAQPKSPPTAEPKSPPVKTTPTKVVRDHRKEPVVRDHRKEPEVRDHRGASAPSRGASAGGGSAGGGSAGGGSAGPAGCGTPGNPFCRPN